MFALFLVLFSMTVCPATVTGFIVQMPVLSSQSSFNVIGHSPRYHSTINNKQKDTLTKLSFSIQEQEDVLLEQAAQNAANPKPEVIYIIMYNPGTDQEGIHTTEYPKDSQSEVMVGFESIDDCITFSNMLKADQSFPLEPVPTPTPYGQMESACDQMGLAIMVVPIQQQ